ncbi:MAG: acyl-CoA thioesterase [Myxococcales bacterium]|nr:acyl-CoA thioesterase [Myxococcales bacterium]
MSDAEATARPARPCAASQVEMTEMVLPPDTNYHGTVFGGRILQWIDIAGAIAAQRHSRRKVVTAAIDDMHFAVPVRLGDVVVLKASVNFVHRTSMEVGVRVEREHPLSGVREHAATAYVTYVALDDDGSPTAVPAIVPDTPEARRREADAHTRRGSRLERRAIIEARRQSR